MRSIQRVNWSTWSRCRERSGPPPSYGGCRGISGILNGHIDGGDAVLLGVLAIALGTFAAFGIGALVAAFITIRFFWDFYMRRRPG